MAMSYGAGSHHQYSGSPVTGFPFTIVIWGNFPQSTSTRIPMSMGYSAGPTGCFAIEFGSASTGFRGVSGSGGIARVITVNHPTGMGGTIDNWIHFAYVCTSTTNRKAYINAGLPTVGASGSQTTDASFDPGTNRTGQNVRFLGTVGLQAPARYAEFAIYNASLNDDEIKALYSGMSPTHIRPQNLEFYVPGIREVGTGKALQELTNNYAFIANGPAGITQFDHPRRYN